MASFPTLQVASARKGTFKCMFLLDKETFFFCIFKAKARECFQGACDHLLVPATEVPETVHLVFTMELLAISSMSEVGKGELLFSSVEQVTLIQVH